jgi:hypothetical protein
MKFPASIGSSVTGRFLMSSRSKSETVSSARNIHAPSSRPFALALHGRMAAAKLIGMDTVSIISIEGMSEAERRAYIIADNRAAQAGAR